MDIYLGKPAESTPDLTETTRDLGTRGYFLRIGNLMRVAVKRRFTATSDAAAERTLHEAFADERAQDPFVTHADLFHEGAARAFTSIRIYAR